MPNTAPAVTDEESFEGTMKVMVVVLFLDPEESMQRNSLLRDNL